jgi:hypothetical protein
MGLEQSTDSTCQNTSFGIYTSTSRIFGTHQAAVVEVSVARPIDNRSYKGNTGCLVATASTSTLPPVRLPTLGLLATHPVLGGGCT